MDETTCPDCRGPRAHCALPHALERAADHVDLAWHVLLEHIEPDAAATVLAELVQRTVEPIRALCAATGPSQALN